MPGFTESNITLDFPDEHFFRFADCGGYARLSGNHLKEMDACWFDTSENLYWLIELKDFSRAEPSRADTIEKRSWDIVKKAIDSLCMVLSYRHAYPYAEDHLAPCFPVLPDEATRFKFITVIHCDTSQRDSVQLIHERFKSKFKPYAVLFGIQHYAVIEHSAAMRIIPNSMIR